MMSGWSEWRLDDCCDVILGQSPPGHSYNDEGVGLPFFQGKADFGSIHPIARKWCSAPTKIAESGDVLVSVRAPVGPTNIANQRCCIGRGLAAIRPRAGITTRWIFYGLRESESKLIERATGTTFAAVSGKDLRGHRLRVPDVEQQAQIVSEIEKHFTRLDAASTAFRDARLRLRTWRSSVLNAALSGRLVETEARIAAREGRDPDRADVLLSHILESRRHLLAGPRYKEPLPPRVDALQPLPEGWVYATVESLSTKVVDGVHKKPAYVENGVPFVTVRNLTAGRGISFEKLNYISPEDHRQFIKRANPERGDLLISKDGTLGVVRAVRTDDEFSIFVSVALIKPVLREMTDFLEIALTAPQVQRQMVPKGSGLQHIHLEDLRADVVPLAPVSEQKRIVEEISRHTSLIDALESAVALQRVRSSKLRQSILRAAFQGELVPAPSLPVVV